MLLLSLFCFLAICPVSHFFEESLPIISQMCSEKFRHNHTKTPVLESLFNKKETIEIIETPTQVFSSEYCETFQNSFFYRPPPVAAFDNSDLMVLCFHKRCSD